MSEQRKIRGFSLLELLVVIAIIGILAAASLPRFAEFRSAAYDSRAQQDLRNLAAAEELFRAGQPSYAAAIEDLSAFNSSQGVVIEIDRADDLGFSASSHHPSGSRIFNWDSQAATPLSSTPLARTIRETSSRESQAPVRSAQAQR